MKEPATIKPELVRYVVRRPDGPDGKPGTYVGDIDGQATEFKTWRKAKAACPGGHVLTRHAAQCRERVY